MMTATHYRALMMMGSCAIDNSSRKQKINTKSSSTESKLVAINIKLGDILWMCYFLESQCYPITENILNKDNMSALFLKKNWNIIGTISTKHIKATYNFV